MDAQTSEEGGVSVRHNGRAINNTQTKYNTEYAYIKFIHHITSHCKITRNEKHKRQLGS